MQKVIRNDFGYEEHNINGKTYHFFVLGAKPQLKAFTLLLKTVGTGLTEFLATTIEQLKGDVKGRESDDASPYQSLGHPDTTDPNEKAKQNLLNKLSDEQLKKIVREILLGLDDETTVNLVDTLMKGVYNPGQPAPINWDYEFKGKLTGLFKALFVCLKVNYSDFLLLASGDLAGA